MCRSRNTIMNGAVASIFPLLDRDTDERNDSRCASRPFLGLLGEKRDPEGDP
jgi:hypothetical protein